MENGGISSLITNLRLCVLLLVVVWCLQKDAQRVFNQTERFAQ